jgi:hypothetical protein
LKFSLSLSLSPCIILNDFKRASEQKSEATIKPKKEKKTQQWREKSQIYRSPYNKFLYSELFIVQPRNEYKICAVMDIHM